MVIDERGTRVNPCAGDRVSGIGIPKRSRQPSADSQQKKQRDAEAGAEISHVHRRFIEEREMKYFIIVGMPAAGKDIARQVARTRGYPYFATGDIVRAEAARRQVSPDAESMAKLSTELRGGDGLGVTRLALKAAVNSGAPVVFMEGIRSKQEIELI